MTYQKFIHSSVVCLFHDLFHACFQKFCRFRFRFYFCLHFHGLKTGRCFVGLLDFMMEFVYDGGFVLSVPVVQKRGLFCR
jgi:hypothetical protein